MTDDEIREVADEMPLSLANVVRTYGSAQHVIHA